MAPYQMYGIRFQPICDLWLSDLKPRKALNGANNIGIATIVATNDDMTPSSTIITLFNVPTRRTVAIPTDT